jgi:gamma-glutamyltranspeptidase/glutathione hydrolase
LGFNIPVQEAVESPRIHHQWIPEDLYIEAALPAETRRSLERRGHALKERGNIGVVQAILAKGLKITGAADPRKVERGPSE